MTNFFVNRPTGFGSQFTRKPGIFEQINMQRAAATAAAQPAATGGAPQQQYRSAPRESRRSSDYGYREPRQRQSGYSGSNFTGSDLGREGGGLERLSAQNQIDPTTGMKMQPTSYDMAQKRSELAKSGEWDALARMNEYYGARESGDPAAIGRARDSISSFRAIRQARQQQAAQPVVVEEFIPDPQVLSDYRGRMAGYRSAPTDPSVSFDAPATLTSPSVDFAASAVPKAASYLLEKDQAKLEQAKQLRRQIEEMRRMRQQSR